MKIRSTIQNAMNPENMQILKKQIENEFRRGQGRDYLAHRLVNEGHDEAEIWKLITMVEKERALPTVESGPIQQGSSLIRVGKLLLLMGVLLFVGGFLLSNPTGGQGAGLIAKYEAGVRRATYTAPGIVASALGIILTLVGLASKRR